ncbi:hypothetical protein KFL_000140360 [Klebsormidium nitens]|uniref:Uncharacterized protein n=1 Tax=Klebsormidium nitens TaxID=105231 RepID=A0A1Y1HPH8_KLENI|nr:hypothetical protein KFL_000140360 [Klebsormidium nitens]|eukprot:GAQ78516.1 hypothetical protein KFL_000140360 [Klebsormidium nitens]
MAKNEPSLVPEWLRQGHGNSHQSQAHHRYHGDGGGPATPRRHSGRDSEPSPWVSGSYVPPGRRSSGAERPPYDRSTSLSHFRGVSSSLSNEAERGESQGGGQEKQSPEGKQRRHGDALDPRRLGTESGAGGGEQASGPSLPTAMPTTTGTLASNVQKAAFERNFPVLGDKFGRFMPSMNSLPSPRREEREGWSSRLADLPSPAVRGGPSVNGAGAPESPTIAEGGPRTPRMAEALQQGMQEQQQRSMPNAPLESHKQEELVLKKMKQLIPLKPTMPKNLLLKPSKKPLHSSTPQPAVLDAKPIARRTDDPSLSGARKSLPGPANGSVGRLQVPGSPSLLANAPATPPSPAANGSNPGNGPKVSAATQKRNDFLKGLRKKALSPKDRTPESNGAAGEAGGAAREQGPPSFRQWDSIEASPDSQGAPRVVASRAEEAPSIRHENGAANGLPPNGYLNGAGAKGGVNRSAGDVELVGEPEGEEADLLRSLGWTGPDTDDEEGALTEEEIRAFFSQTAKLNQQPKAVYQNGAQTYEPTSPISVASVARQGIPLKPEVIVGSYSSLSSGLSSSDDESDY